MTMKNEPNLCIFLQFPGGSDNYLTISGSSHPFLSSEVGLYIFALHGHLSSDKNVFVATKPAFEVGVSDSLLGFFIEIDENWHIYY